MHLSDEHQNALLVFVDYRGPRITSREHAFTILTTHHREYAAGGRTWPSGVSWRERLRKRVHLIKRSDFPNLVGSRRASTPSQS